MNGSSVPASTLVLLLAAGVCLALEAVGTRAGERKRIQRGHVAAVVVAAACAVAVGGVTSVLPAAGLAGPPAATALAIALALVGFAACEGAAMLGERAAIALTLGAVVVLVGTGAPPSSPEVMATLGCAALAIAAVAVRSTGTGGRSDDGPTVEAATKQLFAGGIAVLLVGVDVVVPGTALGVVSALVGLMLALGLPPLHGPRLDLAHGAPPGVAALAALPLVGLGPTLAAQVVAGPRALVEVLCVVGCAGLPLAALGQVSIRRMLGLLAVSQLMLPVTAAIVGHDMVTAAAVAAAGVVGLAVATAALPPLHKPGASWEDISGAGRLAPWRAGLVVFVAAFACGLPPTIGFSLRRSLAHTAGLVGTDVPGLERLASWLPTLLILGGAVMALPVVRTALFLFAKTPRSLRAPPLTSTALTATLTLGAVVAMAVLWSGLDASVWLGHP